MSEDANKYPSAPLAYDLAVQSYDWASKRFDVLDERTQGIIGLGVSLTVAAPVAVTALRIQYDVRWIAAAAIAFLAAIVFGISARMVGQIKIVDPSTLYDPWIQYTQEDFKRYFVFYAGKHTKANVALLEKRFRLLSWAICLFVLEALLFAASVVLAPQTDSLERPDQDQARVMAEAVSVMGLESPELNPALHHRIAGRYQLFRQS